jgi:hypothetical protein
MPYHRLKLAQDLLLLDVIAGGQAQRLLALIVLQNPKHTHRPVRVRVYRRFIERTRIRTIIFSTVVRVSPVRSESLEFSGSICRHTHADHVKRNRAQSACNFRPQTFFVSISGSPTAMHAHHSCEFSFSNEMVIMLVSVSAPHDRRRQ